MKIILILAIAAAALLYIRFMVAKEMRGSGE